METSLQYQKPSDKYAKCAKYSFPKNKRFSENSSLY